MRIAFDVDGVVLNSIEVILGHMSRSTGKRFSSEELFTWELENLGVDEGTIWAAIDHLYGLPWVEPYADAVEVLSRIYHRRGEPLIFITGRRDPETARRQLEVLPWNSVVPEMIVTGGDRDKRPYLAGEKIDFIVEDDLEYANEYRAAGIGFGLMLRPWNHRAAVPVTERFDGWLAVEQWYLGLEARAGNPERRRAARYRRG